MTIEEIDVTLRIKGITYTCSTCGTKYSILEEFGCDKETEMYQNPPPEWRFIKIINPYCPFCGTRQKD